MTLKETWEFHTNLVGKLGDKSERWDKVRKKDLTVNNPEEDKDQDLASASETNSDKCKQSSDYMRHSKSSYLIIEKVATEIKVPRERVSRTEN